MKVAALVPSLNPDKEFTAVIDGLIIAGFSRIYVVNDGSAPAYEAYFAHAEQYPQCVVLRHEENKGKGRALKTAFARYLADDEGLCGLVTLDGDGQHSVEDVLRVAGELQANPGALILGARDFSEAQVPTKNALGNKITRRVLGAVCGFPISDTQTGLRGIPNRFVKALLDVNGERYEFETNMLLETKRAGVAVREVPISTIYINNNSASHFRPLQDGLRIYLLIFKFALSSFASFLVDYGLFNLLNWALAAQAPELRYLMAVAGARAFSAVFNFIVNKKVVFASRGGTGRSLWRYTILCLCQAACSYGGIYLLSGVLLVPAPLSYILVNGILFCISFFIQRKWVFR